MSRLICVVNSKGTIYGNGDWVGHWLEYVTGRPKDPYDLWFRGLD